jgi:hypothetical protein
VGRARIHPIGELGLVYGDMRLADLVRTSTSPMPDSGAGTIPYAARFAGVNWSRTLKGTTLGATLGLEDTRLDLAHSDRAAFDIGVRQSIVPGVRVAAAAHLMSRLTGGDAAHDLYAGAEWRVWRGNPWRGSGPGALLLRAGIAAGHGVSPDYHAGFGVELGGMFLADFQMTRIGGYADATWCGSAGIQVKVGRYRVRYARDTGVSDFGSAYRVGLEAEIR